MFVEKINWTFSQLVFIGNGYFLAQSRRRAMRDFLLAIRSIISYAAAIVFFVIMRLRIARCAKSFVHGLGTSADFFKTSVRVIRVRYHGESKRTFNLFL